MCNNCKGNLKLISYKWNDGEMIYRYQCKNCKKDIDENMNYCPYCGKNKKIKINIK